MDIAAGVASADLSAASPSLAEAGVRVRAEDASLSSARDRAEPRDFGRPMSRSSSLVVVLQRSVPTSSGGPLRYLWEAS
jgi:hypothetical protein